MQSHFVKERVLFHHEFDKTLHGVLSISLREPLLDSLQCGMFG